MDIVPIFVVFSLIFIIIIAFYLQTFFKSTKLKKREPLIKFSSDIRYDPFPQTININNPYECSGSELHECDVNDQLSCIGCQSLIAKCVHFSDDGEFIDINGNITPIPKNSDQNKGYCLTIKSIQDQCNVYHGDLALIQITPESNDTMIICNCKNPGLIGNTTINGSCETIFICDGDIDNINKPIDQINCNCRPGEINERLNDIPSCREMTVNEANSSLNSLLILPDASTLLSNIENNFNLNIKQNINSKFLLNPCAKCPITNKVIENHAMASLKNNKSCSISFDNRFKSNLNEFFGIPFRKSQNERLLAGDYGADTILGVYWEELVIYEGLDTYKQRFVFIFKSINNEEFYDKLGLNKLNKYAIAVDDLLLGVNFAVPPIKSNRLPISVCMPNWPKYNCNWSQNGIPDFNYRPPINIEPLTSQSNTIYRSNGRTIPSSFLWSKDNWENIQKLNLWFDINFVTINNTSYQYLSISTKYFTNAFASQIKYMCWGFRPSSANKNTDWEMTLYTNGDINDWYGLKNNIIFPNTA